MGMAAKPKKIAARRVGKSSREPATERDVRVRVFEGHTSAVWRAAMPANGRFALTAGDDGTVRRWELESHGVDSKVICKSKNVSGLAVTADGNLAAAGGTAGTIFLGALSTEGHLQEWAVDEGESICGLSFTRGGRELVSAGQRRCFLSRWDVQSGKRVAQCKLPFANLYSVATSVDGSRIVGASWDEGFAVWSGSEDKDALILNADVPANSPLSLPADSEFAFTGTKDGKVAKWNITDGRRIAAFEGHRGEVYAVAVTPDGRFCASGGGDLSVRLWAAETGKCLAILRGHTDFLCGVAITPDGRRIASASADRTLRVWDIPESILARAATSQKRGYVNAKVVLVGDSGVGKSGLALRLWHDRWERTESTHGLEIQRLTLPEAGGEEGVQREVWLWDLAGQPDYRLTHQLFMEQTALALLVFDPQDDKVFDTVGYWQSALQKVTAPVT